VSLDGWKLEVSAEPAEGGRSRATMVDAALASASIGSADAAHPTARPVVAPLARALALLSAYTPRDEWLGNGELVARTGLPRATVTRLVQTLASQGYLYHSPGERKYKLAPRVLGLGYGATSSSTIGQAVRAPLQAFAEEYRIEVCIASRDRLDAIMLTSYHSALSQASATAYAGMRLRLGRSAVGWALLAALPGAEREYLIGCIERQTPREWQRHRRKVGEAIQQVHQHGFCWTAAERDPETFVVATPLSVVGYEPLVLACVGATAQMTRARVTGELGPRLRGLAPRLADEVARA
jgi:DNA-binding IclR family transcriptional regulator